MPLLGRSPTPPRIARGSPADRGNGGSSPTPPDPGLPGVSPEGGAQKGWQSRQEVTDVPKPGLVPRTNLGEGIFWWVSWQEKQVIRL